jgi:hypothetical protein
MKKCTVCDLEKPFSDFGKSSRHKSGYLSGCKQCESIRHKKDYSPEKNRERYLKNRELYLKQQKEYSTKNKNKIKVRSKKYYEDNKKIFLQAGWKKKGIKTKEGAYFTLIDFKKVIEQCGSKCQICGGDGSKHKKGLVVDHDHTTGVYRGILCAFCNTAIGYLQDDPEIMKKAINSIEYSLKGELYEFTDPIIKTQIVSKNDTKEDEVNLEEFLKDIIDFCNANMNKNIEMKFSIKVTEE